jgi:hypothetical protein
MRFNHDIDNQDEDSMSNEEDALKITIQKCKEATKRADIMTEHSAI